MTEVELIVHSRPLPVETLNHRNSLTPITPSNLLTLKSSLVMPPPGEFIPPDLYSKKRWRRVQLIAEEFWNRWRKEFLQSLQPRQKWKKKTPNFTVGDIVLLKDECQRNQLSMARIASTKTDEKNVARLLLFALLKCNWSNPSSLLSNNKNCDVGWK